MLQTSRYIDVEAAGIDTNGGHHEADTPDVRADAEFTIPKGLAAVDREEHSCLAPLLGQTTQSCADGTATAYGWFASTPTGARHVVFSEPLSITDLMVLFAIASARVQK